MRRRPRSEGEGAGMCFGKRSGLNAAAAFAGLVACLSGCARKAIDKPEDAMRPASRALELADDLPIGPLVDAVKAEVALLEKEPETRRFVFGPRSLGKAEYLAA